MKNEKLSLDDAQILMTKAIKRIEKALDDENDAKAINAGNCLSGLVNRYAKLVETVQLEKRIDTLEQRIEEQSNHNLKAVK